ncbi:hypothetical protein DXG01_005857 [Tephrocybe rancida]|nr:hypothetical protein DXG01_005857 [Tephrocybe rancida]
MHLVGDAWKRHGKIVAAATPFLPGSFDQPPCDPAAKMNSGYKAWEFLLYLFVLGLGVLYDFLLPIFYTHFCGLIYAVRIINQRHITKKQLEKAIVALAEFVVQFEVLYYQRRSDRVHFVRQSIHQLLHLALEVLRLGPAICSSQWTMERTIGNLVRELRQPSNPYANLAQQSLLRSQVNALKVIVPDFLDPPSLPQGSIPLGSGYVLLHRRQRGASKYTPTETVALVEYIRRVSPGAVPHLHVRRWGRLQLPNGQVARSTWVEETRSSYQMASNVKGTDTPSQIGQVQFYFITEIGGVVRHLAFVVCYGLPHAGLLETSKQTLWSCSREDGLLRAIDVKSIQSVVAMVPHEIAGEQRYFLAEKPGLDISSPHELCSEEGRLRERVTRPSNLGSQVLCKELCIAPSDNKQHIKADLQSIEARSMPYFESRFPMPFNFPIEMFIREDSYNLFPEGHMVSVGKLESEVHMAEYLNNIVAAVRSFPIEYNVSAKRGNPLCYWSAGHCNKTIGIGPWRAKPDLVLVQLYGGSKLLNDDQVFWPDVLAVGEATVTRSPMERMEQAVNTRSFLMSYSQDNFLTQFSSHEFTYHYRNIPAPPPNAPQSELVVETVYSYTDNNA